MNMNKISHDELSNRNRFGNRKIREIFILRLVFFFFFKSHKNLTRSHLVVRSDFRDEGKKCDGLIFNYIIY